MGKARHQDSVPLVWIDPGNGMMRSAGPFPLRGPRRPRKAVDVCLANQGLEIGHSGRKAHRLVEEIHPVRTFNRACIIIPRFETAF